MQNETEHIDDIFRKGVAEEPVEFETESRWKGLSNRLLLNEILELDFTNVNRTFLYSAIVVLFLISLSIPVIITTSDNEPKSKVSNHNHINPNNTISVSDRINTENTVDSKINETSDNYITGNTQIIDETPEVINEVINKETIFVTTEKPTVNTTINNSFEPASLGHGYKTNICSMLSYKNINLINVHTVDTEIVSRNTDNKIATGNEINDKADNSSEYFSLGIGIGSTWVLNENEQCYVTKQPIFDGGINVKYNTEKYFITAGLTVNRAKSTFNSNYTYDTLLGRDLVMGYEIVEVINDNGDTVMERIYYSGLHEVYDTLQSTDQVGITSYTTALSIPLNIGAMVFRHNRFSISATGGVMLNVMIGNNQQYPLQSNMNKKVIDFETSPSIIYEPVFYIQAGLLFEYKVSDRFNMELNSNYNHKIGHHNMLSQYPLSLIRMGFGVSYSF